MLGAPVSSQWNASSARWGKARTIRHYDGVMAEASLDHPVLRPQWYHSALVTFGTIRRGIKVKRYFNLMIAICRGRVPDSVGAFGPSLEGVPLLRAADKHECDDAAKPHFLPSVRLHLRL